MLTKNLPALILLLFCCGACVDLGTLNELQSPEYQAEFAVPLFNSEIGIGEILAESPDLDALRIDETGLLHFEYRGAVLRREAAEIFDQISAAFPPVIPILSNDLALPFTIPNGISLDRLDLKAGTLSYYLENPNEAPVDIVVRFPTFVRNGEPLEFMLSLPAYSGSGPRPSLSNQDNPIDIAEYAIVPQNDSVYVNYTATTDMGAEVSVASFLIQMENLSFSYAEGFLGQLLLDGGMDEINIDFFDTYIGGDIYFAEPQVTFEVESAFGVPIQSMVNTFEVSTVDGSTLGVISPLVDNGVNFPFPSLSEVGQSKSESFLFDKHNSNLDKLLGEGPTKVNYDIDVLVNPDNDPNVTGFLTDSSYFSVQMAVDLPLFGTATGFSVNDTIALDLSGYEEVEYAEFKVITENELGIDLLTQVYFIDEQNQVLDSLLDERTQIATGAPVDENGLSTSSQSKTTLIDVNAQRFDKLKAATALVIEFNFSSESNSPRYVKLIDTQKISIRMGAIIGVSSKE